MLAHVYECQIFRQIEHNTKIFFEYSNSFNDKISKQKNS